MQTTLSTTRVPAGLSARATATARAGAVQPITLPIRPSGLGRSADKLRASFSSSLKGATPLTAKARASPAGRTALRVTASADSLKLQEKFGIPGSISFEKGEGGLTKAVLTHVCGSRSEIYLFGACITSWKQVSGDEVLYVRPDAVFDGVKPISGGIPHCFPRFGPSEEMQQHGFARNVEWAVSSTSADPNPDDPDPSIELVLEPNDYTRAMWDYDFKLFYRVSLHGETLETSLTVVNEDKKPMEFTGALHSYFEVTDIEDAAINGLTELGYLDKLPDPNDPTKLVQSQNVVTFSGPMDSVYLNAPQEVSLEVGTGAMIVVQNTGWPDCVVWNPGEEVMPACYKKFCCVENAVAKDPVKLKPGEDWTGRQTLFIADVEE